MRKKNKEEFIDPLKKDFINLLTDFGFKRIFASAERSNILKRFLNALFEGEMHISTIEFRDKELLPFHPDGKRIMYDIYCTTDSGKHFIIEMQQEETENFTERILFYICRAIVDQGYKGKNYILDPVYCIVLTKFNMSGRKVKLLKEMLIMEKSTHELYTENIKLIFIALPEVPKDWNKCNTELLQLLYIIKNMEDMNKTSKPYLSGEYDEFFDAAATENLTNEEAAVYAHSYFEEVDHQNAVEFSHKKGIELGSMNNLKKNVHSMREHGFNNADIANLLNEPLDLIESL